MTAIKKILYPAAMLLVATLLWGCSQTDDDPAANRGQDDDLVAVELIAAGGSVQVTRADDYVNPVVQNAVVLVFNQDGSLYRYRSLNYIGGERVYLRAGTYKFFAVGNLSDDNCPNGTAANFLRDVQNTSQLDDKYILAGSMTSSQIIMCSGLVEKTLSDNSTPVTISLDRVQTKIDLNIYNRTNGSVVNSGVDLHSFRVNNIPLGSYVAERPTSRTPYDYQGGYKYSTSVDFSSLTYTTETLAYYGNNTYRKYNIEIFTFENRKGTVAGASADGKNRKTLAPANALEVSILGYADNMVLNTFVLIGKGREGVVNPPDTIFGNFDVDRNCVYHVNVVINGIGNVQSDSRREFLGTVVCGDLDPPTNGSGFDF